MNEIIHDRLASRFTEYSVARCLHDVPPHEVYEVRVDDRRAVYKGTTGPTGRAATEGHVMRFVDEHTTVPVPTVRVVGDSWFLMDWNSAAPTPDAESGATDPWVSAAGRALARLHDDSTPAVDGYGDPEPAGDVVSAPQDDWHAAAVAYLRHRHEPLARYGHADVVDAAVDALTDRPDAFAGAGDSVLCHGWWTPAHVAVEDDRATCVVDFEHALAAPAEYDYWRTVILAFEDAEGADALRAAYESVRPLPAGRTDRAPFFRLLCLVYYFESLHVQAQYGPEETRRRAEGLRETTFDLIGKIA